MSLKFWRRRVNGKHEKDVEESEKRLKESIERRPEVYRAQRTLEEWIENALRGGHA